MALVEDSAHAGVEEVTREDLGSEGEDAAGAKPDIVAVERR